MEMKTDIADYVLEKASIKKGDMKMRGGKLDPKAMAALKTMSAEDAKVMIQGLPTNLRRSTMKELGIKEVVDIRTQTYKETVTKLAKAKSLYHKMEAELPEDTVEEAGTNRPRSAGRRTKPKIMNNAPRKPGPVAALGSNMGARNNTVKSNANLNAKKIR